MTLTGCLSLGPSLSQVPEHGSWTSCCSAFSAFPIAINQGQRHIHLWASLVLPRLYNATIARNIFCVSLSFPSSLHLCSVESSYHENHEKHPTSTPSPFAMAANVFDTSRNRFRPSLPPWTGTNAVGRVRQAFGVQPPNRADNGGRYGTTGQRGAASVARASATKMLHLLERMKRNMSSSAMEICSYKLYQFYYCWYKKMNHPYVYAYHPFMVMGMVYYGLLSLLLF